MRNTFQKFAVGLLALACLYSLVGYWISIKDLDRRSSGDAAVEAWEARLEPVPAALPVKRGVVGYLAEWDVPGIEYAFGDVEAEYFLSQYVLSPLILVRGTHAEWSVSVLDAQAMQVWEQDHPGEFEIIQLKPNVHLLHRLDNP